MGSDSQGAVMLARYGLGGVAHFSDPDCTLYRAFGLERVPFWRFLRWQNLRRGWQAFRAGHGGGLIVGDAFRMPGVFVLHDGRVVQSFRHENPHDQPEYEALARPASGVA
jgi:hypothetical protein